MIDQMYPNLVTDIDLGFDTGFSGGHLRTAGIDHSGGIWNFDASSEAETESDGLYRGSEKQRIERSMYVV